MKLQVGEKEIWSLALKKYPIIFDIHSLLTC